MANEEGMLPADVLERPELERKTRAIIDRLLTEKGIRRYVIFDEDEEASEVLPGGVYPVSGHVLTAEGRVFHYWLDWHADQGDYNLGEADNYWSEVDISAYENDPDRDTHHRAYHAAKRKLGLPQHLVSRYVPPRPRPSVLDLQLRTYARLGQRFIPHLHWWLRRANQVAARSPGLRAARAFELRISGLDHSKDRYELAYQQLFAITERLMTEVFRTTYVFSTEDPDPQSRTRSARGVFWEMPGIRSLGVEDREIATDRGYSRLAGLGRVTAANFAELMQASVYPMFDCLLCTQAVASEVCMSSLLDQLLALQWEELTGVAQTWYRVDYVRLVAHVVERDMAVVAFSGHRRTSASLSVFVPGSLREPVARWLEAHLPEFRAGLTQRAEEWTAEIKAQETGRA